jgi:hypothetical protein
MMPGGVPQIVLQAIHLLTIFQVLVLLFAIFQVLLALGMAQIVPIRAILTRAF